MLYLSSKEIVIIKYLERSVIKYAMLLLKPWPIKRDKGAIGLKLLTSEY
jgi:hypothetical protein